VSSLVVRLCLLVVAAFGSRPRGVPTVEQPRSGVVSPAHERTVDHDPAGARIPAPSLRLPVRAMAGIRAPATPASGGANPSPAELSARTRRPGALARSTARVARRTPCAACGDGSPYDATAPPASSARAWLPAPSRHSTRSTHSLP